MSSDDLDQPLGEYPDLDLSYTHRDGRHVPFTVKMPTDAEVAEWRRRSAELDAEHFGVLKPLQAAVEAGLIPRDATPQQPTRPNWDPGEYRGPSRGEMVLLLGALAVLLGILVYLGVTALGAS